MRRLCAAFPLDMEIKNLGSAPPFVTKDGSEIRELLAYRNSAIRNQSLAEARLPVGASTQERAYYIAGMTSFAVVTASVLVLLPGRLNITRTTSLLRRSTPNIVLIYRQDFSSDDWPRTSHRSGVFPLGHWGNGQCVSVCLPF
jgi:hypothetical protein